MTDLTGERPTLETDAEIRTLLQEVKTIALLGASPKAARDSNKVLKFLLERGYDVHPVNPGHAGEQIHGRRVYAALDDVPAPIDMVDVFRNADALPGIVDEVLRLKDGKSIKALWAQLDVVDRAAAEKAHAGGLKVVMDHCPAIEIPRLF